MKLMINVEFKDKYTKTVYRVGEVIDFEEERANELLNDTRSLVSKVKPARKKAVKK